MAAETNTIKSMDNEKECCSTFIRKKYASESRVLSIFAVFGAPTTRPTLVIQPQTVVAFAPGVGAGGALFLFRQAGHTAKCMRCIWVQK